MTRFVALGYAVFALENRAEADAQTQFADAQASARAALSLPTTLNLIAWGEGLGGTLAIAAAAKQPQHVVKCAAQNPSHGAHMPVVRNMPRSSSARC